MSIFSYIAGCYRNKIEGNINDSSQRLIAANATQEQAKLPFRLNEMVMKFKTS